MNLDTQRWGVPDQTYGFAKLAGEFLARAAVRQYGMDVVIYRPFSGYGEDQALDYPFPSIIQRGGQNARIRSWSGGSGLQTRDFIHIDDVVEAVVQTKDVLPNGAALNLGRGEAISFLQLARLACRCVRQELQTTQRSGQTRGGVRPRGRHLRNSGNTTSPGST